MATMRFTVEQQEGVGEEQLALTKSAAVFCFKFLCCVRVVYVLNVVGKSNPRARAVLF